MPHYATLSNIPSIYDNKVIGYAVKGVNFRSLTGIDSSFTLHYMYVAIFASNFVVIGLSTPLFVTISEAINKSSGKRKPKLYYHFWSAVLLIIGGLWGYEVICHIKKSYLYAILLFLMIVMSLYGTIVALSSDEKIKAFSAPLSESCCCAYSKRCRNRWSCFMTIIGVYFTISLLTYLLYAVPTIVLVYYLYPTRTLIRVPFIIGAIFYTITLQSLVFYQFEILCYGHCCKPKYRSRIPLVELTDTKNSYGGTQSLEVNNTESKSQETVDPLLKINCLCTKCEWDEQHIEQQYRCNIEYYTEKSKEDMQSASRQCHTIIALARFFAGIIILAAFIYGEIVVANLVFKQTTNTDISSLLTLLPTVLLSIFAWFGRSLIFDVREDMKELNIPCFKKKESTEERMLNAINELVELQRSRIEQERHSHTTAEATGDGGQSQGRNTEDAGGRSGEDTTIEDT